MGWSRTRRAIVLRRRLKDAVGLRLSDEEMRAGGHPCHSGPRRKGAGRGLKNSGRRWRPKGISRMCASARFLSRVGCPRSPRRPQPRRQRVLCGVWVDNDRRLSLVQTLRRWWTEVGSISTTTETGPKVLCELDPNPYPKGVAVTDDQMASQSPRADFHGEWNYTIKPRPTATKL